MNTYPTVPNSLYRPEFEHDACGVGFVANTNGRAEHRIVALAVEALCSLAHRGALDADAKTGDGAGILTQLPKAFFKREAEKLGAHAVHEDDLAVAMVFLPRGQKYLVAKCQQIVEEACAQHGVHCLGWRQVPVNARCLGDKGRDTMPEIQQAILARAPGWSPEDFERKLFLARKQAEGAAMAGKIDGFYIPSMSGRTIVYKGLFNAPQLTKFYPDLKDPMFVSSLAIYHQRYSTNTFPNWRLAHPFRMLAHNGEINTLLGNKNWTRARERELTPSVWGADLGTLTPILQQGGSDSSALDNALETLQLSGRDLLHCVMMLAPEAWENMPGLDPAVRGFYEYHSCLNEPWDGPAAVVFSDGRYIGATLDRNGLRPARYKIYEDGLVVMGSEVGVVSLDEKKVVRKGRLGPGKCLAIDTATGVFMDNDAVKALVAGRKPYAQWCADHIVRLAAIAKPLSADTRPLDLLEHTVRQIAFGWDQEQVDDLIQPMATQAAEPIGSMGDDTPFAVLSKRPRLLFDYFKQLFAQVTNPPIDSIREKIVMSLGTSMGARRSWFEESPEHARQVKVESPFLYDFELSALRELPGFRAATIPALFGLAEGPAGLATGLDRICAAASQAVDAGKAILVLTDRGIDAGRVAIPMLLAMGAVHHHLIREGKRLRCSIVCESGEARDVHHFASLIGFGASAVNPYVAIDTVREGVESGKYAGITVEKAVANFRKAIEYGLLKVMSKMGISTIASYRGAQIFEAIGLGQEVVDRCFFGTTTHVGGIGFDLIAADAIRRHQSAFGPPEPATLDVGGNYRVARGGRGEYHAYNPQVVLTLHRFIKSGQRDEFVKFMETVANRDPVSPRDLLRFKPGTVPVPIDEVEPIDEIRRRFTTAGMSL
ncbi:MAG: glutamate synthase subunit alpha, partial [Verrucomicrobia bacterium]